MQSISHFGQGFMESEQPLIYRVAMEQGCGAAEVYPVLPGVEVVLLDLQGASFSPALHEAGNVLELNYCLRGRVECRMRDGCLQYLGEGDLFISTLHNHSDKIELPLGHYKGVAVAMDLDGAATAVKRWLPDSGIDLHDMAGRLLEQDECLLVGARPALERILSGADRVPSDLRPDAYRLRMLELLLYLSWFDLLAEKPKSVFERQQVEIVKRIHAQITARPERRFPIEELAKEHCISPTALKAHFKGIYGTSIAAYMKAYRARQAAGLLRNTRRTVAEIAADMGYESQSKFGAAFKSVMGMTPVAYRNKHRNPGAGYRAEKQRK